MANETLNKALESGGLEPEPSAELRIYVACLASYNAGRLHGRWIDVDGKDEDALRDEVEAMLRESPCPNVRVDCPTCEASGRVLKPGATTVFEGERRCPTCKGATTVPSAEEFAIHDHEGFGDLVGEYTSLADVAAIAEVLAGENALGFRYLVEDLNLSAADAAEKAADVQIYRDDDAWSEEKMLAGYAQELTEECDSEVLQALPDFIRHNIDWEAIGREMEINGDVASFAHGGERVLITNPNDF